MGKVAVVIGAGPVGSLAAIALARRGFDVQVFEKRPVPKQYPEPGNTTAYLMNLNSRGLRALEHAGVDYASFIPQHNGKLSMTFYAPTGKVVREYTQPVSESKPKVLRLFRDEISAQLISEAKRLHPKQISFTFEAMVGAIDLEQQLVDLASKDKLSKQVHYDLLVGADGAGSIVRQALQETLPPGFVDRVKHDVVYTGETYTDAAEGEFPDHGYFDSHFFSAGVVTFSGNRQVSPRFMLFLNSEGAEQVERGEIQWLLERLEAELPRLSPGAKASVKSLVTSKPTFLRMSGWTTLTQLHGHKVVLLGDAAHTVTPVLGQGCNAGLEDVAVFGEILDAHKGDINAALPAFTKARLPDVKALVKLNMIAAQERASVQRSGAKRGHQVWLLTHGALMRTHLALHTALNKLSPRLFNKPAFTRAVIGEVPYRTATRAMYWDVLGLAAVAAALTVPLVARNWRQA